MRKIKSIFLIMVLGCLNSSVSWGSSKNQVWVVVIPKQCLANPWEKTWAEHHKGKSEKYPLSLEPKFIKDYFALQGVTVYEVRRRAYDGTFPICMTCDCDRGDTLFFRVNASDGKKMAAHGYTKQYPLEFFKK